MRRRASPSASIATGPVGLREISRSGAAARASSRASSSSSRRSSGSRAGSRTSSTRASVSRSSTRPPMRSDSASIRRHRPLHLGGLARRADPVELASSRGSTPAACAARARRRRGSAAAASPPPPARRRPSRSAPASRSGTVPGGRPRCGRCPARPGARGRRRRSARPPRPSAAAAAARPRPATRRRAPRAIRIAPLTTSSISARRLSVALVSPSGTATTESRPPLADFTAASAEPFRAAAALARP